MSSLHTAVGSNATFDPFTQSFALLLPNGTTFNVSMTDLDAFNQYGLQICINYGSQVGASFVLLIVLVLLTKPEKRGTPIFLINAFSLLLNTIRSVLQCLYFTGAFYDTYAYLAQDYSHVPASQYATSITGDVFTLTLLICIELSLILQTQVVCATAMEVWRRCITAISVLLALVAVGFRFGLVIENAKFIIAAEDFSSFEWLASAANITTSISICYFCAVFITKLGFALHRRRRLGLRQFGPMHIIFIMGCQTLVIPAIFSILQYFTNVPELGTNVLTLVAIFLPLSSMWASSSLGDHAEAPRTPTSHRKLFGSYASNSSAQYRDRKASNGPLSPADTDTTRVSDSILLSGTDSGTKGTEADIEAQVLDGVRIDHRFSIANSKH
ncbi:MAG: hypothetical protein M1827_004155 [Pycnora praestabilis]|nr:MAG: hypothetical protein M1827_004155 [Pycnora praestabilis]